MSALKTTPWERTELRYWLDRPDEWDVIIWQRMDRAVRSMADMADLGRYAKKHRERLIFASGPGGGMLELDFTSIMSEFMMMFLAFAAQLEGQTIMERNQGAAAYLQQIGRWPGGSMPVRIPTGPSTVVLTATGEPVLPAGPPGVASGCLLSSSQVGRASPARSAAPVAGRHDRKRPSWANGHDVREAGALPRVPGRAG